MKAVDQQLIRKMNLPDHGERCRGLKGFFRSERCEHHGGLTVLFPKTNP